MNEQADNESSEIRATKEAGKTQTLASQADYVSAQATPDMLHVDQDLPEPAQSGTWLAKILHAAVLVVLALVLILFVRPWASSPDTYKSQIETLDEKKSNVMILTGIATSTSAAITLIPDDVGTPIADKLADLSGYLIVILTVIYLEKFLITILGFLGTGILIPVGLGLFAVLAFFDSETWRTTLFRQLAIRRLAFGLAVCFIVPVSVMITETIDETYADTVSQSIARMEESASDEADSADSQNNDGASEDSSAKSIWTEITKFFEGAAETVTNASTEALNTLTGKLNELIDTIAVMIVTSCIIPLTVLFVFFKLANSICGIDLGSPDRLFSAASGPVHGINANVRNAATKRRSRSAARTE